MRPFVCPRALAVQEDLSNTHTWWLVTSMALDLRYYIESG